MKLTLHPVTRLIIALFFLFLVAFLPLEYQAIFIFVGALIAWTRQRLPYHDPGKIFIRLWLVAGFFLILIHCISWNGELVFSRAGLISAGRSFFRIGSLMVAFLWLIRTVRKEALYSMLLDFRIPMKIIYVLFQAIYFLPRFGERAKEILLAQQARGFALKGVINRLRAYILILTPLLNTMIYEMEENAAAMTAKGLNAPGKKSHLTQIRFASVDILFIIILFGIAFTLIFYRH